MAGRTASSPHISMKPLIRAITAALLARIMDCKYMLKNVFMPKNIKDTAYTLIPKVAVSMISGVAFTNTDVICAGKSMQAPVNITPISTAYLMPMEQACQQRFIIPAP